MKILKEVKENEIVLHLNGQIDSSNAQEVEKQISELIQDTQNLVLDFEHVSYVSSAGLRIVLHLAKTIKDFMIINVETEVYHVFSMTGFTNFVNIKKAYRQIDIKDARVIGEGAKGIVYRLDAETVLKVYKDKDMLNKIEKERELAKQAFILGVPTAISYEICKVGDLYGSVFELLECDSLSKLIAKHPENIEEYAKNYALLLKLVHSTEVDPNTLPNGKEILNFWINISKDYLYEKDYNHIKKLIDNLEDEYMMLHADIHTNNVMVQDDNYLLIDMDTLCYGNKIIDLAIVDFTYNTFNELDKNNTMKFLGINSDDAKKFYEYTLKYYFEEDNNLEEKLNKISLLSNLRIIHHLARRSEFDLIPEVKEKISALAKVVTDLKL